MVILALLTCKLSNNKWLLLKFYSTVKRGTYFLVLLIIVIINMIFFMAIMLYNHICGLL